jgi:transcriptional repressor NrdR
LAEEGASVRRRRECVGCGVRFTTYERVEEIPLVVVKSDGGRQPFDRAKIVAGVMAATKGRSVDDDVVAALATAVEDDARLAGNEVTTSWIGKQVLERLRCLDDVSYLRFASVYKDFDGAADFHRELELLSKLADAPSE